MKYQIIGSSSKGNCIVVEEVLMLDCGVSYKKIKSVLNRVKLIFISHDHKDHLNSKTVKQIIYNFPNIKFLTGSKYVVLELTQVGVLPKNVIVLNEYKWYNLGMINVRLQPLTHDTPNYALNWVLNDKKGLYIVDTANVDNIIDAKDYDLYLIENNYQEKLLKEHIDNCTDESMLYYLNRVPKTHLSNEKANTFLIENMGKNSIFEYIHQSEYNYKGEE